MRGLYKSLDIKMLISPGLELIRKIAPNDAVPNFKNKVQREVINIKLHIYIYISVNIKLKYINFKIYVQFSCKLYLYTNNVLMTVNKCQWRAYNLT